MIERGVPSAGTTTYQYSDLDELLSLDGPQGAITFQYDLDGNQTQKSGPDGVTTYTWDAANVLRHVITASGNDVQYGYDSSGKRVTTVSATRDERIVFDGDSEHLVLNQRSNTSSVRFDREPTSLDSVLAQQDSRGKFFLIRDVLGSVTGLAGDSGNLAASFNYDAFGRRSAAIGNTADSNLAFTSRPLDPETGLQYHRARYYDASIGSFTQRDPMTTSLSQSNFGLRHTSAYDYALQNPIAYSDPTGLLPSPFTDPLAQLALFVIADLVGIFYGGMILLSRQEEADPFFTILIIVAEAHIAGIGRLVQLSANAGTCVAAQAALIIILLLQTAISIFEAAVVGALIYGAVQSFLAYRYFDAFVPMHSLLAVMTGNVLGAPAEALKFAIAWGAMALIVAFLANELSAYLGIVGDFLAECPCEERELAIVDGS